MHVKKIDVAGEELRKAKKALVMVHGRGASAADILSIAPHLAVNGFALLAPQATNHTWYPFSFLAPPAENEPWLGSAIDLLKGIMNDILAAGLISKDIYFLGFSQGACLTLEFAARNAARFGGIAALTGGLIGDKIYPSNYKGNFEGTPIFLGAGDPDPHVPVERVYASSNILRDMGADVTEKIYPGMGHTINADEIEMVNHILGAGY